MKKAIIERSFLHNIGVNGILSLEHIDWDVIEGSDIVFVAGFIGRLVEDLETVGVLEFACAVGASTGIVHKEQIYKFIHNQQL